MNRQLIIETIIEEVLNINPKYVCNREFATRVTLALLGDSDLAKAIYQTNGYITKEYDGEETPVVDIKLIAAIEDHKLYKQCGAI